MSESIIVADDLTKSFAQEAGVFDLSLDIGSGTILGLIGPSGSGKTTTVRLMIGVLNPDSGSVNVFGETPTEFETETRARIGYMPQESILYPELTLEENLDFAATMYGMPRSRKRKMDYLSKALEIDNAMDRLPIQASGGEKRRLMLAATLVHDPELLFLDEPTAGIDPVLRKKIWDRLSELAEEGRSLIVTTQYVGEAAYCDYVAVLDKGRILAMETPTDLRLRAFGGELVDVVFADQPTSEELDSLERALDGRVLEQLDGPSIRLVVDDAGEALPQISKWSSETGVGIVESESHVPPFDDVFVELVERLSDEASRSEEQPDPR